MQRNNPSRGAAKKRSSTGKTRQLEAPVHTSLPPMVTGPLRGHVQVSLEQGIHWEYSIGPPAPKLCVQLKWWGEKSSGTIFRVPVYTVSSRSKASGDCTTLALYQLRSGWSQFKAYVNDMGSLTVKVGLGYMTDDSMVIGHSILPSLAKLSPTHPLSFTSSITNPKGLCLGKLKILFSIQPLEQVPKPSTRHSSEKVKSAHEVESSTQLPSETGRPRLVHEGNTPGDETNLEAPEFIVGPGAGKLRVNAFPPPNLQKSSSPTKGRRAVSGLGSKGSPPKSPGPPPYNANSAVCQRSPTEDPVDDDSAVSEEAEVSIGPRQLEVISELIDRGNKLREEMIHSVAKGLPKKEVVASPKEQQGTTNHPLLLAELAQDREDGFTGIPTSDNLHELLCLGMSSDEENGSIVVGTDDISVIEPDYPLHDKDLLARLLYSEDTGADVTRPHAKSDCPVNQSHQETDGPGPKKQCSEYQQDPTGLVSSTDLPAKKKESEKIHNPAHHRPTSKDVDEAFTKSKLSGKLSHKEPPGPQSSGSSLTTLSSFLGSGERSLESSIVRALGMEQLTNLGRVSRARVCVESLEVDTALMDKVLAQRRSERAADQRLRKSLIPLSKNSSSSTYFVEYQFPAALNGHCMGHTSTRLPTAHEVMRVASKKTVDNGVSFNHQSVFPVCFNSSVIQRWWNSTLIFRVYCKKLTERMPFLVGKAVVPLRTCLSSPSLATKLEVRSSTLTDAVNGHVTDKDPLIGHLQISIQLVTSDKRPLVPKVGKAPHTAVGSASHSENTEVAHDELEEQHSAQPAVKLQEPKLFAQTISPSPTPLHLLLHIPEGTEVLLQHTELKQSPTQGRLIPPPRGVPNSYIVCKLFCAKPHPRSMVQWASHNPQFGFKQVYPLYLTPALLEQVCNNFTVIEVWHKTPGPTTDDELVGLVKVSLHQFYLTFSDKHSEQLHYEEKLPVVAMDSYCPIVNPFSGNVAGHIAVLCALGTSEQVGYLQQQFACGTYCLHRPHIGPSYQQRSHQLPEPSTALDNPSLLAHVFEVSVEGVRELSVFNNTVWGETDCFVQYHFPSQLPEDSDTETITIQPYRTDTTLCVPNPSFSHSTRHTLTLTHTVPIQQELVHVCGQGRGESGRGLSGGVTFELWRRFYYPNIRNQLIAKASLPIVKLCAMVSMGKGSDPATQTFSLPLKLVSQGEEDSAKEGGLLDVTISYKAMSDGGPETVELEDQGRESSKKKEKEDKPTAQNEGADDADNTREASTEHSQLSETHEQDQTPETTTIPEEELKPVPEDVFQARIIIHSALHLQFEHSVSPGVYVTLHPHPNVDKVSTPDVPYGNKPVWDYHCLTYIPNMYLQSQCSGLELQVWSKCPDSSLPHAGGGNQSDCYIGCVYVDLSPLAFGLRQISGWYNIVDFGGQVKGQLKATVSPTTRISYPSRLLSYQLESPPESFISKTSLLFERPRCPPPASKQETGFAADGQPVSRTTSMLYQQLRDNISELDSLHKSLQTKLGEIERTTPFLRLHSKVHPQTNHQPATTNVDSIVESVPIDSHPKPTRRDHLQVHVGSIPTVFTTTPSKVVASNAETATHAHNENSDSLSPHIETPNVKSPSFERENASPTESEKEESYTQEPSEPSHEMHAVSVDGTVTKPSKSAQTETLEVLEGSVDRSSLTDVSLTTEDSERSSQHESSTQISEVNSELSSFPAVHGSNALGLDSPDHTMLNSNEDEKESIHSPNHIVNTHQVDSEHIHITEKSPEHWVEPLTTVTSTSPPYTSQVLKMRSAETIDSPQKSPQAPQPLSQANESTTWTSSSTHARTPSPDLPEKASEHQVDPPSTTHTQMPQSRTDPKCTRFQQQMPNFFMPPEELEESMRRLRASILSRPVPRTRLGAHKEEGKGGSKAQGERGAVNTLQEVQRYLDSRKVQRLSNGPLEIPSNETQRIARIFSSTLTSTEK